MDKLFACLHVFLFEADYSFYDMSFSSVISVPFSFRFISQLWYHCSANCIHCHLFVIFYSYICYFILFFPFQAIWLIDFCESSAFCFEKCKPCFCFWQFTRLYCLTASFPQCFLLILPCFVSFKIYNTCRFSLFLCFFVNYRMSIVSLSISLVLLHHLFHFNVAIYQLVFMILCLYSLSSLFSLCKLQALPSF